MARLLCLQTCYMMDTIGPRAASDWISKIKVIAPRVATKVIDEAIQMHGAMGISQDTFLADSWIWQRTLRLADGPDAVRRHAAEEKDVANDPRAAVAHAGLRAVPHRTSSLREVTMTLDRDGQRRVPPKDRHELTHGPGRLGELVRSRGEY